MFVFVVSSGCMINKEVDVCCNQIYNGKCVSLGDNDEGYSINDRGECKNEDKICYGMNLSLQGNDIVANVPYCPTAQYPVCGENCTVMRFSKGNLIFADDAEVLFFTGEKVLPNSVIAGGILNYKGGFLTLLGSSYLKEDDQLNIFRFGLGRNFDEYLMARMLIPLEDSVCGGEGIVERSYFYINDVVLPGGRKCELRYANDVPHYVCDGGEYNNFYSCLVGCGGGGDVLECSEKLDNINLGYFGFGKYDIDVLYGKATAALFRRNFEGNFEELEFNSSRFYDYPYGRLSFAENSKRQYSDAQIMRLRTLSFNNFNEISNLVYLYFSPVSEYATNNIYLSQFLEEGYAYDGILYKALPFECSEEILCKSGSCDYDSYERFACLDGEKEIDCGCNFEGCYVPSKVTLDTEFEDIVLGDDGTSIAWINDFVPTIRGLSKPSRVALLRSSEMSGHEEEASNLAKLSGPWEGMTLLSYSRHVKEVYFNDSNQNDRVDGDGELKSAEYLAIVLPAEGFNRLSAIDTFKNLKPQDRINEPWIRIPDPGHWDVRWPSSLTDGNFNNNIYDKGIYSGGSCYPGYVWCNVTDTICYAHRRYIGTNVERRGVGCVDGLDSWYPVPTYRLIYDTYVSNSLQNDVANLPILRCVGKGYRENGDGGSIIACDYDPINDNIGNCRWDVLKTPRDGYIKAVETIEDEGFICLNPLFRTFYTPPDVLRQYQLPYNTSVVLIFGKREEWKRIYENARLVCDKIQSPQQLGISNPAVVYGGRGSYDYYFGSSENAFTIEPVDNDGYGYKLINQVMPQKYYPSKVFCSNPSRDWRLCTGEDRMGDMALVAAFFVNPPYKGNPSKFGRCDVAKNGTMRILLKRHGKCKTCTTVNLAVEKIDPLNDSFGDFNGSVEEGVALKEVDSGEPYCFGGVVLLGKDNVLYGCPSSSSFDVNLSYYYPSKYYIKEKIKMLLSENVLPLLFVDNLCKYEDQCFMFSKDVLSGIEHVYSYDFSSSAYVYEGKRKIDLPVIVNVGTINIPTWSSVKDHFKNVTEIIKEKCRACLTAVAFPFDVNVYRSGVDVRARYSHLYFKEFMRLSMGRDKGKHCVRPNNPMFYGEVERNGIYTQPMNCEWNVFDVFVVKLSLKFHNPPYEEGDVISEEEAEYFQNVVNVLKEIGNESIYYYGRPVIIYIDAIEKPSTFSIEKFFRFLALNTKSLVSHGVIGIHIEDLFAYDDVNYKSNVNEFYYGFTLNRSGIKQIDSRSFVCALSDYASLYSSPQVNFVVTEINVEEDCNSTQCVSTKRCIPADNLPNNIEIKCKFPDGSEKIYRKQEIEELLSRDPVFYRDIIASITDNSVYTICFDRGGQNLTYKRLKIPLIGGIPIAYDESLKQKCIEDSLSLDVVSHYLGLGSERVECVLNS